MAQYIMRLWCTLYLQAGLPSTSLQGCDIRCQHWPRQMQAHLKIFAALPSFSAVILT